MTTRGSISGFSDPISKSSNVTAPSNSKGMSIKICFSASDRNILADPLVRIYREQCGLEVIPN